MSGLRLIEPTELYNLLNQETTYPCLSDPVFMLLIDAREKDNYNESHIITAKRAAKDDDGFVVPFDADLECKTHVVVYDSHASSLDDSDSEAVICGNKLWASGSRNPVEILNGGYEAFSALYPFHRTQKIIYMPRELDVIETYPSEIIPGSLYLGRWQHGNTAYTQKELRVKGHINCSQETGTFFTEEGSSLMHIAVSDEPESVLLTSFEAASEFINQHRKLNQVVLVFSQLGISRSATIVIAYLMQENNWSLKEAFNRVHGYRPTICPNVGFMQQLIAWDTNIRNKDTENVSESVHKLAPIKYCEDEDETDEKIELDETHKDAELGETRENTELITVEAETD